MPLPRDLRLESLEEMEPVEMLDALEECADALYEEREAQVGPEQMRALERAVMLRVIDSHWVEHLTAMQNLRQGIGLQAYGQRDPLVMYKKEAHQQFNDLLSRIQHDIVHTIYHMVPVQNGASRSGQRGRVVQAQTVASKPSVMAGVLGTATASAGGANGARKVGRNDSCPCGSGKKYKRCHGAAV